MKIGISVSPPVVSVPLPPLKRILHDYESQDAPRPQFAPDGYLPRTYRDKHNPSLPETTKRRSDRFAMTLPWCQLEYDLINYFAPANFRTDPPKGIFTATELGGAILLNRMEEVYLRINHGQVYKTNGTGWNDEGFYDLLTGAGAGTKPYKRETMTCCGNVVWSAGGDWAWAIDALAPAPTASQVLPFDYFVHASTACYGRVPADWPEGYDDCVDKTFQPNGKWRVTPFGDLDGGRVPILFVSADPTAETMEWNGLHLRKAIMEMSRLTNHSGAIPSPYVP